MNSFARKFLGFSGTVCWAGISATRTPAAIKGAKEVRLYIGRGRPLSEDTVLSFEKLWLFEPKERYEQLIAQLESNLSNERALRDIMQEIAVLIPMIRDLSLSEAVARVNETLPINMRCSVSP